MQRLHNNRGSRLTIGSTICSSEGESQAQQQPHGEDFVSVGLSVPALPRQDHQWRMRLDHVLALQISETTGRRSTANEVLAQSNGPIVLRYEHFMAPDRKVPDAFNR